MEKISSMELGWQLLILFQMKFLQMKQNGLQNGLLLKDFPKLGDKIQPVLLTTEIQFLLLVEKCKFIKPKGKKNTEIFEISTSNPF